MNPLHFVQGLKFNPEVINRRFSSDSGGTGGNAFRGSEKIARSYDSQLRSVRMVVFGEVPG